MADTEATLPTLLNERLYSIGEAARFLRITSQRLRRWLEGGIVAGTFYPPVIRPDPTGDDVVTWAEFVEAALLREYRRHVSLQHLRPLIDGLREQFEIRHPLAHFVPLVDLSRRRTVIGLQRLLNIRDELSLAQPLDPAHGVYQIQWAAPVERWLERVEFDEEGIAKRMRPLGAKTAVVLDPEVTFGIPQIRGIRTETIAEAYATTLDASVEEMATEWGLRPVEVEEALKWELTLKEAA